MVRLEKQEVETMMGLDLQAAEETIAALDKEIPRLEKLDSEIRQLRAEKVLWEEERAELIERGKEAEILQTRQADMMKKTGEVAGDVDSHLRSASMATSVTSDNMNVNSDVHRIISILRPLWAILPSPEARAARFGNTNQRSYRTD
jgi:chemotaxis regulatin CheY-phosphate phosphatase CheZ